MITEIIITIIVMVGGGIIITIIITGTIIIIVIIITITTDHSSSNEVNMTIGDMMIDVVAVIVAGIITTMIEVMMFDAVGVGTGIIIIIVIIIVITNIDMMTEVIITDKVVVDIMTVGGIVEDMNKIGDMTIIAIITIGKEQGRMHMITIATTATTTVFTMMEEIQTVLNAVGQCQYSLHDPHQLHHKHLHLLQNLD